MSDILNAVRQAHADHDPHGFKNQGANSPKHAHVNAPYAHEEFPKLVYKGNHTKTVNDVTDLQDALEGGFSEEAPSRDETAE